MKKSRLYLMILAVLVDLPIWSANGDIFTATSIEGVDIKFKVVSEDEKTCEITSSAINTTTKGTLTIPSVANDYTVFRISYDAFKDCSSLTAVIIPQNVVHIYSGAFMGCSALTTVKLPSTLRTIGYQAFCLCSSLTTITIPASVTTIANLVFSGCTHLESITVDAANTVYDSRDNCNAIVNTSTGEMIAACKGTTLPGGIKKIGDSMFSGRTDLTSVVLPEGLESLGQYVFSGCKNLQSLTFPSTMKTYGEYTLSGVSSMRKIILHNPEPPTDKFHNFFWGVPGDFDIYQFTWYVPEGTRDAYISAIPWWSGKEDGIVEISQCATPVISYRDGHLYFDCDTDDVEFHYSITTPQSIQATGNDVALMTSYVVKVYATREGYKDSEVATAGIDVRGLKGDVNNDGQVNAIDAVSVINLILGKQ